MAIGTGPTRKHNSELVTPSGDVALQAQAAALRLQANAPTYTSFVDTTDLVKLVGAILFVF